MLKRNITYRGIALNPFDNWVYGSLLIIKDETTDVTSYFIHDNYRKIEVDPDTICRKVYSHDGVAYFDKDIIEYDQMEHDYKTGVRRIEPIIDDSVIVYVGRQRNIYAHMILSYEGSLNIKVLGNTIENPDLLDLKWQPVASPKTN